MRAVLAADSYTKLEHIAYKATDAECHEILAIGAEVEQESARRGCIAPKVGQHCYVRSTAADRMAHDDKGRFWLLDLADLKATWDPQPLSDV